MPTGTEALNQWELPSSRQPLAATGEPLKTPPDSGRERMIERHLRTIGARLRSGESLRRLRQFKQRCAEHQSKAPAPGGADGASALLLGQVASNLRRLRASQTSIEGPAVDDVESC